MEIKILKEQKCPVCNAPIARLIQKIYSKNTSRRPIDSTEWVTANCRCKKGKQNGA